VVGALVVALLASDAYYSSRVSESAPKVVYSISFDEAKAEAQAPLLINIKGIVPLTQHPRARHFASRDALII
jgi:hypothetical protein